MAKHHPPNPVGFQHHPQPGPVRFRSEMRSDVQIIDMCEDVALENMEEGI
jgi:hypothetical protein